MCWFPHDRNPTDGLTKPFSKSHMKPLLQLMRSGCLKISSEQDEMMLRAAKKEELGYVPRPKTKSMFVHHLLSCFTEERQKQLSIEVFMSFLFEESYRRCAGENLTDLAKELRLARHSSTLQEYSVKYC